jgi:hypothetical protein
LASLVSAIRGAFSWRGRFDRGHRRPDKRGGGRGRSREEVIRGAFGTNLVGADLVEISPPYDTSGNTARLGANLFFENAMQLSSL